jgi:hypothetical protein
MKVWPVVTGKIVSTGKLLHGNGSRIDPRMECSEFMGVDILPLDNEFCGRRLTRK